MSNTTTSTTTIPSLAWWRFGGSNLQALYGYGTEREARAYRYYLNRGREANHYYESYLGATDAEAEAASGVIGIGECGVALDEAIVAIASCPACDEAPENQTEVEYGRCDQNCRGWLQCDSCGCCHSSWQLGDGGLD